MRVPAFDCVSKIVAEIFVFATGAFGHNPTDAPHNGAYCPQRKRPYNFQY